MSFQARALKLRKIGRNFGARSSLFLCKKDRGATHRKGIAYYKPNPAFGINM